MYLAILCQNNGGKMELSTREQENLKLTRAWSAWTKQALPSSFLGSLENDIQDLLIEMLMHFELWGGVARSVYGDGALVVTEDDKSFTEQLERLIQYNIQQIYMVTTEGDGPKGPLKRLISHVTFAKDKTNVAMGCSDAAKVEALWGNIQNDRRELNRKDFEQILACFSGHFLEQATADHIVRNILLFYRCLQDLNVKVELQDEYHVGDQICIALANRRSSKTGFFLNLIRVIQSHGFKIVKAQSVYVAQESFDEKALTHFYVLPPEEMDEKEAKRLTLKLLDALAMVQWFEFENSMNRNYIYELNFSLHHSILLRAVEEFVYQMLVQVDESLYTPESIHEAMVKQPDICRALVDYFISRFNPKYGGVQEQIDQKRELALSMIARMDSGIAYNDRRRKTILKMGVHFIESILKTNYYVIRRSALSFRVCSSILDKIENFEREKFFPELPFAIFFVKGKNFIGVNVRFRDLARGGVRTLLPMDREKLDQQHKEVFRECYGLAYTQQAKNKDIPEGGSKSVIFVKLHSSFERDLASDKNILERIKNSKGGLEKALQDKRNTLIRRQLFDSQQSYCDTLLDLLIWNDKHHRLEDTIIKDYYGREELVFLGPDENMTNPMIEWISNRSKERNYKVGTAFMSGKQDMGINHKAYGVTSLGVHQYLNAGLEYFNLTGKEIAVKVSGGPDGDVAGNEIVNLIQDFGEKLKLLAIQDGTGLLYDPKGIDHAELMRLFNEGIGVAQFKTALLNEEGFLLSMHKTQQRSPGVEEVSLQKRELGAGAAAENWLGASEANSMYSHFLLGLKCDVFLPCGGRPRTLSVENWHDFFVDERTPSARLIVEGANLYLDQEARQKLEERGVVIIKDASANKCGVICSSYEIMSGLVLTPEEFKANKDKIVKEVLVILKDRAQKEARLLINCELGQSRIQLTELLSNKINHLGDQIRNEMALLRSRDEAGAETLLNLVAEQAVPPTLLKLAAKKFKTLPHLYQNSLVASFLASTLIYKYGLNYQPSLLDSINFEIRNGLFEENDTHRRT